MHPPADRRVRRSEGSAHAPTPPPRGHVRTPRLTSGPSRPILVSVVIDIDQALCALVACDGSDLHLKVGSIPLARVDGELGPLSNDPWPVMTSEDTQGALRQLIGDGQRFAEFEDEREIDLSHEIPGVARFRINAFRQRGGVSLVARAIPHRIRTIEELALPPVIETLAEEPR